MCARAVRVYEGLIMPKAGLARQKSTGASAFNTGVRPFVQHYFIVATCALRGPIGLPDSSAGSFRQVRLSGTSHFPLDRLPTTVVDVTTEVVDGNRPRHA